MKKIFYIGLMVIALMACKSKDGTIMGSAKAGDTLSGITVNLYNMDSQLISTTSTDGNGNFVFSSLPSGNYYIGATIVIGSDTYDTGNLPKVVYVNDSIVKEISLTLTKKS
ncbi:MAG: carboxypeptidase regulatory-like domain-containing protein [Draconibacterium sp.]|nr:carboxypeptidase regulatory-like domain-containing protein [Draconibacterium sp.]